MEGVFMHTVKLLMKSFVTHDVKRFIVEKPEGYAFTPGQATDVALKKEGWEEETRPFTFTNLVDDGVLEFIAKEYPLDEYDDHDGMTPRMHDLEPGDELLVGDAWGTIEYKDPGVFIAGGAGITPFIAIFRDLHRSGELAGNRLIFSNKKQRDVILEKEWREYFGADDLVLSLTREEVKGYEYGRVDADLLEKYVADFSQHFYVCGPPPMVGEMKEVLTGLGAEMDAIVFEE